MPTPTANYAFDLPSPGGDDDAWGGFLNGNWTALDTLLFSGTLGANTTGAAARLATARAIGGVSFDGTADINLPGVNQPGSQNTTGSAARLTTARTLTVGATGKTFDGAADVSWSVAEIDAQLNALAALAASGIIARTGTNTVAARSIAAGANITVTNGDGVSGNPTIEVSGNLPAARITSALNAAGAAPIYACRAWVNFDGNSAGIRGSGNVSSITKFGIGNYRVNFTTAMQDANYSACANFTHNNVASGFDSDGQAIPFEYAAGSVRIFTADGAGNAREGLITSVAIFR